MDDMKRVIPEMMTSLNAEVIIMDMDIIPMTTGPSVSRTRLSRDVENKERE